jgi:hypothetical protein
MRDSIVRLRVPSFRGRERASAGLLRKVFHAPAIGGIEVELQKRLGRFPGKITCLRVYDPRPDSSFGRWQMDLGFHD